MVKAYGGVIVQHIAFDRHLGPKVSLAASISYVYVHLVSFRLTSFSRSPLEGVTSKSTQSTIAMAAPPFVTAPEEIRQQIIHELAYTDKWALKQTCKLFAIVVAIPTIHNFFLGMKPSRSKDIAILWKEGILPFDLKPCYYCERFRSSVHFSRAQKKRIYPPDGVGFFMFCLDCGVRKGHYVLGQRVIVEIGVPDAKAQAVMACAMCGKIVDYKTCCGGCRSCRDCITAEETVREEEVVPVEVFQPLPCLHSPSRA